MVLGSIQFDLCIASQSFAINGNDKLLAKMFLQKVATRVVAKKMVCWLRKSFRQLTTEGAYASCVDAVDAGGGYGGWYGYWKILKFTVAFDAVWCNLGPLLLIKKCPKKSKITPFCIGKILFFTLSQ